MRVAIFLCVFAFMVFGVGSGAFASEAKTRKFTVGDVVVWAIADSLGDRDMSVFIGLDPDVQKQYAPLGKSPSAVMAFLVKTKDETILIDTGMNGLFPAGLAEVSSAADVTKVLITHMHGDHINGLVQDGKRVFGNALVLASRQEREFWLDEKSAEKFPDRKAGLDSARRIMGIYGADGKAFEYGDIVAEGADFKLEAIDAHGHTPGHTVFMLTSNGERLLFWADLSHAAALQFPRPDINATYDMNPEEAAKTRLHFMELAATEKLTIAGVHLPFPGVGAVEKAPVGYTYKSR
ncbi:MBL fold metallo-hydrolase [Synergistales bacterium]|nr:MBL fold metallo-hydrolase [Synergistales bacterium]